MTMTALLSALTLGLAGSLHCLGMCGPLAAAIPGRIRGGNPALVRLYYHAGRAVTYAMLGLLIGGVGEAFRQSGLPQLLSILCGVALVTGWLLKSWVSKQAFAQRTMGLLQKATVTFMRDPRPEAMWVAGMLNGLLPCGLVYTAMAAASLMPDPGQAALFMLIFGVGTMPALYAVSSAGGMLQSPGRVRWQRATPVLTLVAGCLLILRGMSLGIPVISPDWDAPADSPAACCPHGPAGEAH